MNGMNQFLPTAPFPIAGGCGHPHHEPKDNAAGWTGSCLQVLFLVSALAMAALYRDSEAYSTFSVIFCSIILEAFPFMLLGTLTGGFIEVFLSRDRLIHLLPQRKYDAIIMAGLLGIIFPVCECAIVPVVRKLMAKGMPLGAALAFLLAGPIVNPLVFASTWTAYGFKFETAFLRVFIGFFIAVTVAAILDRFLSGYEVLKEDAGSGTCRLCHDHNETRGRLSFIRKIQSALQHGALDFYDIGRFLIMGAFIAAALQTFVPRQAFTAVMSGPLTAIGSMMALAIALNLCSEADAFIAASFGPAGVLFSAQLAFMVLGPMLDIKLILMYLGVFKTRLILCLSVMVIAAVFLVMTGLELSGWLGSW